jgi:hypothetical protein
MSTEAAQLAQPHHLKENMTVAYGLDDGAVVEFYQEPVHMEFLSKQVGSPIFQERIFTRIMFPGNRLTTVVHQAKGITYEMALDEESGEYHTAYQVLEQCENGDPTDPAKYPKAWNRFLRKGVSSDAGFPIEEWGAVTRSYAASLKAQNIHTVEALAGLTDQAAQSIMGGIKYRDLARARIDEVQRTRIVAREQERAAAAEERLQVQTKQIEALQQEVLRLQALFRNSPPAGDGRNYTAAQEQIGTFNGDPSNPAHSGAVKRMSRKDAQAQHKIPPPEAA